MSTNEVKFWRGVFSDADGTPSFSRVASGFALCFACGWITAVVLKHYALPDFAGISMFVGTLYGINKVGGLAQAKQDVPKV